jgi:thiol-disulfide isomerase/thioredoxin
MKTHANPCQSPQCRRLLLLLSLAAAFFFTASAQSLPVSLIGNWIETQSNRWDYGFFEPFAVYDCGYWDYSTIQQQGTTTRIVLKQGAKTLRLEVVQNSDSTLTIQRGKAKKQQYLLMGKRYPNYQTPDATPFPAPTFCRDSATLIGYYRNFDRLPEVLNGMGAPDHMRERYMDCFEIAISDFITGEMMIDCQAAFDSLGRFSITVPICNSQLVHVDWKRLRKTMLLSPNDTFFLFVDALDLLPQPSDKGWEGLELRDKQILYMGKNARVNNELVQYKPLPYSFDRNAGMEKGRPDLEYLRVCEEAYHQRAAHLAQFIAGYPAVSEKFRFVQANVERYEFASNLMQRRFNLNGRPFQEGYMDYVSRHFLPVDHPATYTLTREFLTFIRDYMGYYAERKSVTHNLKQLLEEANLDTPENIQTAVAAVAMLEKLFAEPDTIKQRQLVESNQALLDRYNQLQANPRIKEVAPAYVRRAFMDVDYHKTDSLLHDPALKELWMTNRYYADFEQARIHWPDNDRQVMESRITNPHLQHLLLEINDSYRRLNNEAMEYEASLQNTDHWATIDDADSILKKITEPHRGKVIFIDVWGTWCGPCIKNIKKYARQMEAHFKEKDVVFIYLANRSPEQAWKNVIKQQRLTGQSIVHFRLPERQQSLLEQRLKVTYFPTYLIVDRAGNISDFEVRYPMNLEETIAEIERNLNANE